MISPQLNDACKLWLSYYYVEVKIHIHLRSFGVRSTSFIFVSIAFMLQEGASTPRWMGIVDYVKNTIMTLKDERNKGQERVLSEGALSCTPLADSGMPAQWRSSRRPKRSS